MKILSVSDVELSFIYSQQIVSRFGDVDLVISCGDLPYYYLEYIISMLNKRLYFVHGNHASRVEHWDEGTIRHGPWGAIDLHQRGVCDESGLLLAGIEGCLQYNYGPHQYSQGDLWLKVFALTPRLFYNRLRYGRYLDVFVTHAAPWKIQDREDRPHRGSRAFRWLDRVFRPQLHLHGHIHIYRQDTVTETQFYQTRVINTYGYKITSLDLPRH